MALTPEQESTLAALADGLIDKSLNTTEAIGAFLDAAKPAVMKAAVEAEIAAKRREQAADDATARERRESRQAEIDALARRIGA